MNGFQLLSRLPEQPWVIFTTAYDQCALKAFEVNSSFGRVVVFLKDPPRTKLTVARDRVQAFKERLDL